jgi:hypothetical protein
MSDSASPGRKTTPPAKPIGISGFHQPDLVIRKPPYREGSMDYQKHPSLVGDKRVPYHVQDET